MTRSSSEMTVAILSCLRKHKTIEERECVCFPRSEIKFPSRGALVSLRFELTCCGTETWMQLVRDLVTGRDWQCKGSLSASPAYGRYLVEGTNPSFSRENLNL
jgi:hypothetical protein